MEGAEHRRKSERKQTTFSAGSAGLSPLTGISRTSGGMATEVSAMFRDKRMAQNKRERRWPLAAWNISQQSGDGSPFKYYGQYPVNQGFQEGKRANLWGPHVQFGANIPMKIGPKYQCLKELGQNSNVYKNSTRIPMFERIRSESQCIQNWAKIPKFGRMRSEFQCL